MSWCGKDMAVKDGRGVIWWVVNWRSVHCWFVMRVLSQNSLMRAAWSIWALFSLSFASHEVMKCLKVRSSMRKGGVTVGLQGQRWGLWTQLWWRLERKCVHISCINTGINVPWNQIKSPLLKATEALLRVWHSALAAELFPAAQQHPQCWGKLLFRAEFSMNSLFPIFSMFKGSLFLSRAQLLGTYPNPDRHWELSGMIRGVLAVASLVLDYQMNQWIMKLEPAGVFHCHQQREALTPSLPESPICKTGQKGVLEEWILRLFWRLKVRRWRFITRMAVITSLGLAQQLFMELQFTAGTWSGVFFAFAFKLLKCFWNAELYCTSGTARCGRIIDFFADFCMI